MPDYRAGLVHTQWAEGVEGADYANPNNTISLLTSYLIEKILKAEPSFLV